MSKRRHVSMWSMVVVILTTLLLVAPARPPVASAHTQPIYFPQTGQYLQGAFRAFWESQSGVATFGYPITPEYIRLGDGRLVQYFERARFELAFANGNAYVELGQLGREFLQARGIAFPTVAPVSNTRNRIYFPQTGHTVQGAFKTYWETRGAVRLFGYPISEEVIEVLPDGVARRVQYFERVRFELHGNRVLLGLLGDYLAPCELRRPLPPFSPPTQPAVETNPAPCAGGGVTPAPVATGRVYPYASAPGTTLGFDARGYEPNEAVSMWINLPNRTVREIPYQAIAASDGGVLIGFRTLATDPPGLYSLVGQGTRSGRQVVAEFVLR